MLLKYTHMITNNMDQLKKKKLIFTDTKYVLDL